MKQVLVGSGFELKWNYNGTVKWNCGNETVDKSELYMV